MSKKINKILLSTIISISTVLATEIDIKDIESKEFSILKKVFYLPSQTRECTYFSI